MNRVYIVPIIQTGNYRYPAGVASKNNPEGLAVPWALMDYGLINRGILVAEVDDTQAAQLDAVQGVIILPVNLDTQLTAGAVTTVRNALEAAGIPAGWVSTADTYRSVLRSIAGIFQYMQRVTAILGYAPTVTQAALNTQYSGLPGPVQTAMLQAAQDMQFDYSGLRATSTLRAILKTMADQWASHTFQLLDTTF